MLKQRQGLRCGRGSIAQRVIQALTRLRVLLEVKTGRSGRYPDHVPDLVCGWGSEIEFSTRPGEFDKFRELLIRSVKVASYRHQDKNPAAPNQTSNRGDILLPNLR